MSTVTKYNPAQRTHQAGSPPAQNMDPSTSAVKPNEGTKLFQAKFNQAWNQKYSVSIMQPEPTVVKDDSECCGDGFCCACVKSVACTLACISFCTVAFPAKDRDGYYMQVESACMLCCDTTD